MADQRTTVARPIHGCPYWMSPNGDHDREPSLVREIFSRTTTDSCADRHSIPEMPDWASRRTCGPGHPSSDRPASPRAPVIGWRSYPHATRRLPACRPGLLRREAARNQPAAGPGFRARPSRGGCGGFRAGPGAGRRALPARAGTEAGRDQSGERELAGVSAGVAGAERGMHGAGQRQIA